MSQNMYETILIKRERGRCYLTLNRPESRNAMTTLMIREMQCVLDEIRDDPSIRSLIMRGASGTFCAGGDLQEFQLLFQGDISKQQIAAENRLLGTFLTALNELPQVVVMLVEGAAIGGGLGLICAGDIAIATEDTKFALSETSLGIPPAQIAAFVVQRIGLAHARRLMLTGARIRTDDAEALGLIDATVENSDALDAAANALLTQIERCSPHANAATKAILRSTQRDPLERTLDLASQLFTDCIQSDDGREGIAAFLEKRKTKWTIG